MTRIIIAALLSLSAATAAAAANPQAGRVAGGVWQTLPNGDIARWLVSGERCPDAMPFSTPSETLSAEWGDLEWELWAESAWDAYCTDRADSLACRCADVFGGGPY